MDTNPPEQPAPSPVFATARRIVVIVIGGTLLVIAAAMIPIPGPLTLPPLFAGLAVLAIEFVWARRLLSRARQTSVAAAKDMRDRGRFLRAAHRVWAAFHQESRVGLFFRGIRLRWKRWRRKG